MNAIDLITDELPPLRPADSGNKALAWMDEFRVGHLPVVEGTKYLGLISDSDILDLNSPESPIGEQTNALIKAYAVEDQHVYDVMKLVADLNLTVVPIIDKNSQYLGCTTLQHLMKLITRTASINDPGGIIVIELNQNDYSLSEIAQIVEGNDAKILSSYITSASDSTKMEVTIKVNKEDISGILQTFYRYDYIVSEAYNKNSSNDDYKNRYDSLMKYLDM